MEYERLDKVIEKRRVEVRLQEVREKLAALTLEKMYWEEQLRGCVRNLTDKE